MDQQLQDIYRQATGDPIPSDVRTYFITKFCSQKGVEKSKRSNIQLPCKYSHLEELWRLLITRQTIDGLWEKAMEGPLRAAQRELKSFPRWFGKAVPQAPSLSLQAAQPSTPR